MRDIAFRALRICVAVTFLYVVIVVVPELHSSSEAVRGMPRLSFGILLVHIATALPPLLIGLIAFDPTLRKRSIAQHRSVGNAYCVCIWISAATGILLATANRAGIEAQLGFGTLGVVWFWTTTQAYRTARPGQIPVHRLWMIRSYATTLAVVTIRPLFWFGPAEGFTNPEWVALCSWLCWVPNLIIAEIYLRSTTFGGKLKFLKRA